MEYRYRRGPQKWFGLYGILVVLFIFLYLWDISSYGFKLYRFIGYLVIPVILMMHIIYSIYRYYKKVSTDLIRLDDSGITQIRNGAVTEISWEEITKVEWRGHDADKFSALSILGTGKVIGIGDHIDGIGEIIQLIKSKVGERFNTHNIPWELKNPKILKEK